MVLFEMDKAMLTKKKNLIGQPNFSKNCPCALALLRDDGFEVDVNPHNRTFTSEELQSIIGNYNGFF